MPGKYDKVVKAKAIRLVLDHAGDYDTEWAATREISTGRPGHRHPPTGDNHDHPRQHWPGRRR